MKKNIEIDKEKGTVTVEVSVSKRNYVREPLISLKTKDIALLLENEGISVDACVQNDVIYNDGSSPNTDGTWVFKLKSSNSKSIPKPDTPTQAKSPQETSNLTKAQEPAKIKSQTRTSKKRK
jgi:hypothetical protein